jgi:hypothetical protein
VGEGGGGEVNLLVNLNQVLYFMSHFPGTWFSRCNANKNAMRTSDLNNLI